MHSVWGKLYGITVLFNMYSTEEHIYFFPAYYGTYMWYRDVRLYGIIFYGKYGLHGIR
jgi:hypothetical protein